MGRVVSLIFYLERFNKTNDIVEIKPASDAIVNKDESLSAKVSQAVDQPIEYMESSQTGWRTARLPPKKKVSVSYVQEALLLSGMIQAPSPSETSKNGITNSHI